MHQRMTFTKWDVYGKIKSRYEVLENEPTTLDGVFKEFYKEGQLRFERIYRDDRPWQAVSSFDADGNSLDPGDLADGTGVLRQHHPNGELAFEQNYKEGVPHGSWTHYHDNGAVHVQGHYSGGKRIGEWKWLTNGGRLVSKGEYRDGLKAGKWKTEHRPNWPVSGEYRDGLKFGEWTTLSDDGTLYRRCIYDDNGARRFRYYEERLVEEAEGILLDDKFVDHGEKKTFDEEGNVKKVSYFDMGEQIFYDAVVAELMETHRHEFPPADGAGESPLIKALSEALAPGEDLPPGVVELQELRASYTTEDRDALLSRIHSVSKNALHNFLARIAKADPDKVIIFADEYLAGLRGERPEALVYDKFSAYLLRRIEHHPSLWLAAELVLESPQKLQAAAAAFGDRFVGPLAYCLARVEVDDLKYYMEWIAERAPHVGKEALLAGLGDSSKVVREAAINGLTKVGKAIIPELLPLLDGRVDQVSAVATILRDLPSRESIPALEAALERQRSAARKEHIAAAINACKLATPTEIDESDGEGVEADETTDYATLDAGLAARQAGDSPDFDTRPELIWKDGTPVSEEATQWIVATLAAEGPERPNTELLAIREHLDDEKCAAFGQALVDELGWERWVIYASGILGGELLMDRLGAALQDLVHEVSAHHAAHGITVLTRSSTPAVRWLNHWAKKAKTDKLQTDSRRALAEFIEREGLTKDALLDQTTPTFDFPPHGEREFDYAGRPLTLVLDSESKVLVRDEKGKTTKSLPRARKAQDSDAVKAAKERFKAFKKAITATTKEVISRLEEAMIVDRRWTVDRWQEFFLENPVLYALSRGLVFAAHESGAISEFFFVSEEGTPTNAALDAVDFSAETTISIPHPVVFDDEQRQRWLELLADAEIHPPFSQLDRVFVLDATEALELDEPVTLPAVKLARSLYGMGYKFSYYLMDGDRIINEATRTLGNFELTLHHTGHYYKTGQIEEGATLDLKKLVARRQPTGRHEPTKDAAPIPESVYSEAALDMQTFLSFSLEK